MKVAIAWNNDRSGIVNRFGQASPERYGRATIERIAGLLREAGHEVLLCEADKHLISTLERFMPPDSELRPTGMVFNLAYGIQGECRYSHVPGMLELAGIPYTGSSPLGHALALDKVVAKHLMIGAGVPTPRFRVMRRGTDALHDLRFPLIVKPRHESTSYGLSLVEDLDSLQRAVESIVDAYCQDALVEEYIEGREICVGLLGNEPVDTLPLVEHDFGDRTRRLVTWEDKMHRDAAEPIKICPAAVDQLLAARLREIAVTTFHACGCRDFGRVDIRVDADGNPFVLEINSMAALGAGASFAFAAMRAGMDYPTLVVRILDIACERYSIRRDPLMTTKEPVIAGRLQDLRIGMVGASFG